MRPRQAGGGSCARTIVVSPRLKTIQLIPVGTIRAKETSLVGKTGTPMIDLGRNSGSAGSSSSTRRQTRAARTISTSGESFTLSELRQVQT